MRDRGTLRCEPIVTSRKIGAPGARGNGRELAVVAARFAATDQAALVIQKLVR
jgi:hypothetical protein